MTAANEAYIEAKRLIEIAREVGAETLNLDTFATKALTHIPSTIASIKSLTKLYLRGTRVWDISALSEVKTLVHLELSETDIVDYSPLGSLNNLKSLELEGVRVDDLSAISALTTLTYLNLGYTKAFDLAPLRNLTKLQTLELRGMRVRDLSPLSSITDLKSLDLISCGSLDFTSLSLLKSLTHLFLRDTRIVTLDPIASLQNLQLLNLRKTMVKDLRPLANLTGLKALLLGDTEVSDVSPISGLTNLDCLTLDNTLVDDLSPLRSLSKLETDPDNMGLIFSGCLATQRDPNISSIAEIQDNTLRARALFDYLQGASNPDEDFTPPPRQPAPLETEILNDRLVVALPANPPLPAGPVDDRARKGWAILKQFRADFANALNIANYRPLASAIAAFDRAMGDSYDHLNEIAVGLAGERLSALSKDADFVQTLPDGAGTELATLGAAISTFANRFPDWLAYLSDPAEAVEVAATVQDNLEVFTELEKSLAASDDVAPAVLAEYRDEVELVRQSPTSESAARALLASTRDLIRTVSENALIGMRLYAENLAQGVKYQSVEFAKTVPAELRKKSFWGIIAITGDIVFNKSTYLMTLSTTFPPIFGWIPKVLAALGLI